MERESRGRGVRSGVSGSAGEVHKGHLPGEVA